MGVTIARVSIKEACLLQLMVYYLNILTLIGKLGVLGFLNTCLLCVERKKFQNYFLIGMAAALSCLFSLVVGDSPGYIPSSQDESFCSG